MQIQQLRDRYCKCSSKEIYLSASKLKTLLQEICSYFSFHLPTIQLFFSEWVKSYYNIYHSPPHNPLITRNILITIIRFVRYHLLLGCNSTFMTYSMHLGTIQLRQNLNYYLLLFNFNCILDLTNRRKLFSIPLTECASLWHQARPLNTNLLGLISNFSKYYLKTDTVCLLFLSSHVFTAFEFDSNHFGILLWKIVKLRNHNEIKPPIRKIFQKYKPIRHYFVTSQK